MIQAEQGYYKPGIVSLTARNSNPTYKRMLQHWPKYIRERSYKSVENVLENNPSFQNFDWEIRVLLKATIDRVLQSTTYPRAHAVGCVGVPFFNVG